MRSHAQHLRLPTPCNAGRMHGAGKQIAFPTMGALHEGHTTLAAGTHR
jgi:pantothenate synthetase